LEELWFQLIALYFTQLFETPRGAVGLAWTHYTQTGLTCVHVNMSANMDCILNLLHGILLIIILS